MKTKGLMGQLAKAITPSFFQIRACKYCEGAFVAFYVSTKHCSDFCRFWSKVRYSDDDGCWEWVGGRQKEQGNYGIFGSGGRAHRQSWEQMNGPVHPGLVICHSCDNGARVRPGHLWPGTPAENMQDRDRKKRGAHGERNPKSKLTAQQIQVICDSPLSGSQMAEKLGVDRSTINKIRAGRYWRHVRRVAVIAALVVCGYFGQHAYGKQDGEIIGTAIVVDGDTLKIDGQRIRLFGIDAPEAKQMCTDDVGLRYWCGTVATAALSTETDGKSVDCRKVDTDRYGRTVAMCMVDGRDIGAEMVRRGWAIEYKQYSQGVYSLDEESARTTKRGIWRGHFENPAQWRREHR